MVRTKPADCSICCKRHNNENAFLTVHKNTFKFYCLRNKNLPAIIGYLNDISDNTQNINEIQDNEEEFLFGDFVITPDQNLVNQFSENNNNIKQNTTSQQLALNVIQIPNEKNNYFYPKYCSVTGMHKEVLDPHPIVPVCFVKSPMDTQKQLTHLIISKPFLQTTQHTNLQFYHQEEPIQMMQKIDLQLM